MSDHGARYARPTSQVQQRPRNHAMHCGAFLRDVEDAVAMSPRASPLPVGGDEHRHRDVSRWLGSGIATRL